MDDTIAAISTALGEGAIAVVRVSGGRAIDIAQASLDIRSDLHEALSHTIHYGFVIDHETNERIEEVLVLLMKSPRSFTTEDIVEVHCHGGIVAVQRVLASILRQGARLAEPGEFTKRAFLNGRIDLSQAEAVMDLIRSKSERAHRVAMQQAEGLLSERIRLDRHTLIELLAHVEVNIDYPEHDAEALTHHLISDRCVELIQRMDELLNTARKGKTLREGLSVAIVGRPNVGKSSLLNALVQENKAIVTDIPGTTRDVVEEYIHLGGIPLRLLDTAGIRETEDKVELIGVAKSRNVIRQADLVLLVLNSNEMLHEDDLQLLKQLSEKPTIVILNKADLVNRIEMDVIYEQIDPHFTVQTSMIKQTGLDELESLLQEMFLGGTIEGNELTYVSHARHIELLKQTKKSLGDALEAADQEVPIDLIQIDLRQAWETLGEILGDTVGESLIDQIFSQFCLGK